MRIDTSNLDEYERVEMIDIRTHVQAPGTIIHEFHVRLPINGGIAIRFCEAPDTPEWKDDAENQAKVDAMLDDRNLMLFLQQERAGTEPEEEEIPMEETAEMPAQPMADADMDALMMERM